MSDKEDVLLEFFVSLPQLKQVTSDKEELVNNIVAMASKYKKQQSVLFAYYLIPSYLHTFFCVEVRSLVMSPPLFSIGFICSVRNYKIPNFV